MAEVGAAARRGSRRDLLAWRGRVAAGLAVALACAGAPAHAQATAAAVAAQVDACARIDDDGARLRCYDLAAHRSRPPRPADPTAPAIRTISNAGAGAGADAAPAEPRPAGRRFAIRADAGYDYEVGDYSGSSKVSHGWLEMDSALGGQGGGALAEVWLDGALGRDTTIGLEYLQINNRGVLTATLPKGLSILTDPVYGHMGAAVRADLGFVNLAWRPAFGGRFHAVAGMGLGGGFGSATTDSVLSNAFIGTSKGLSRSVSPIPALQGFAGFDADLGQRLYLSFVPRLVYVNAHPIDRNQRYADVILALNLGYRF